MIPLLIKTYDQDAEWLFWCLSSLKRFAPTLSPIHIVTERGTGLVEKTLDIVNHPNLIKYYLENELPEAMDIQNGYIRQQYVKLNGDIFIKNPNHIQLDSDCVITELLDERYWGNLPIWFFTSYNHLFTYANEDSAKALKEWKSSTEGFLGFPVLEEHMRCCGFYMKDICLIRLRKHLEEHFNQPFIEIFRNVSSMSEYNIYGSFCHYKMPEYYHWIDTEKEEIPKRKIKQYWSYGGIPAEIRQELSAILSR